MICVFEYMVMQKKAASKYICVRIEYDSYCIPGERGEQQKQESHSLDVCTSFPNTFLPPPPIPSGPGPPYS